MEDGRTKALQRALGLTLASAVVWGVAHLWTGRRVTGSLLLGAYSALAVCAAVAAIWFRQDLLRLAVQPAWLTALIVGALLLGFLWMSVVLRSYQLVRPEAPGVPTQAVSVAAVLVLCLAICAPFVWAAHSTFVYRDALTSIFHTGNKKSKVSASNPWEGKARVNVLLLGGDSGSNRIGVRTDSVTLASIDTKTGDAVLLGLPRNLQSFALPPGPAADRFPNGFTGDGPQTPGLLNEVYQYAEEHPEILPGVPKGERGPALLGPTVSGILGQPVDYFILVDMAGFAEIVNAMGGVYLKVEEDITFGKYNEGRIRAGYQRLNGTDALWYGRSRTFSDDYVRMSRQKCLLRAIARQADPKRILTRFQKLAVAAKHTISTDIPPSLLPALVDLSSKAKSDAKITSLQFVPPMISAGDPDFALIRQKSAKAIADSQAGIQATASPTPSRTSKIPSPPGTEASDKPDAETASKPVSLDSTCPS